MHAGESGPAAVQALAALERRESLFDHRFDGWSSWRVMRNAVHRHTEALPLSSPSRSTLVRSLEAMKGTLSLIKWLILGKRVQVLVKTARSGLRQAVGDRFKDVYFDGLLDRHPSYLKLEEINSSQFDRQAAAAMHPSGLNPVVFTFWGRVLGKLRPVDAGAFCETLSTKLAEHVGVKLAPEFLLMRVSTVHWQAKLYGALLARVRPHAVLVSDTGEYALSLACKRNGIPFIELQHGVFDSNHPDAVPDWVQGSAAELLLPDRLACRGSFWIARLAATRQGNGLAVPVGDEMIDQARLRMQTRDPARRLHLVVSSQGIDTDNLAAWIKKLAAAAPADKECTISVKLHPSYDVTTRSYDGLATDPRVRIIGGSEQPNIFSLLADADMHLSISSSCHFDALSLGVPTTVIPLAGHELMLPVIDGRRIVIADRLEEVWQRAAVSGIDAWDAERYAAPGYIANLERLLPL